MICISCGKNEAIKSAVLGVLPCAACQIRQKHIGPTNGLPTEFTRDSIKEERRAYKNKVIQPWRGDTLSKEYLDEFGTKGIVAEKEDVENAKYVWDDLDENYYKGGH